MNIFIIILLYILKENLINIGGINIIKLINMEFIEVIIIINIKLIIIIKLINIKYFKGIIIINIKLANIIKLINMNIIIINIKPINIIKLIIAKVIKPIKVNKFINVYKLIKFRDIK